MMVKECENKMPASFPRAKIKQLLLLAVILLCVFQGSTMAKQSSALTGSGDGGVVSVESKDQPTDSSGAVEIRFAEIEKLLQDMKITLGKAERRSLENKLMNFAVVAWVKAVFIALIIIAVSFPITIWLISRKRLMGLPGLSDEVAATIVVVEERQAKLVSILKEIQSEVEYLQSSAGPDLKNLLEQAEKYLQQNKRDLERIDTNR
jgi:hypothetical protein